MATQWNLLLCAAAFLIIGSQAAKERGDSIDELIVNAAESANEFEFFYDKSKSLIKYELDMIFSADELHNGKRSAGIYNGAHRGYRWTDNQILYQLAPNTFSVRDENEIYRAMAHWTKYTCLTFHSANSGNRVYYQNGRGCSSRVGMTGGPQTINLAPGCRYSSVVIHELGHAIGLHHEQTRPDRDSHVQIISKNIPPQRRFNFERYGWNVIQNFNLPYDYESIMHYGPRAFSSNGGLTIRTLDPKYQEVIGSSKTLSFGDIKTVNLMYNCKAATRGCKLTDDQCPGQGFVGKDCKCWCPGNPYVHCAASKKGGNKVTTKPVVTDNKLVTDCYDRYTKCASWARQDQCTTSASFMIAYCPLSCKLCTRGATHDQSKCRNYIPGHCEKWAKLGYCSHYYDYMKSYCPLACGHCTNDNVHQQVHYCRDIDSNCKDYASYCNVELYQTYMSENCQKTCRYCSD